MKRILTAGALAALVSLALIATAGATSQRAISPRTITVFAKTTHESRVGQNRFSIRGVLLKASDHSQIRGKFHAVFNKNGRIRAVAIFANGKIKVDGFGNHAAIIGGTRKFEGVTGTMRVHPVKHNNARLVFHIT